MLMQVCVCVCARARACVIHEGAQARGIIRGKRKTDEVFSVIGYAVTAFFTLALV
jgi:hypothetical protein